MVEDKKILAPTTSSSELEDLDKNHYLKALVYADTGTLQNIDRTKTPSSLKAIESEALSPQQIENFSDFTIETFYKVHTGKYAAAEIETFREHQKLFFSRPYHALRHEDANKSIKAYLAVGLIKDHPLYNQDAWHVGYWGISAEVNNPEERKQIKTDWGQLLRELNKNSLIVGIIDYFNKPSLKVAQTYNMKLKGYRLDPK